MTATTRRKIGKGGMIPLPNAWVLWQGSKGLKHVIIEEKSNGQLIVTAVEKGYRNP
jgi:hypothetical protein